MLAPRPAEARLIEIARDAPGRRLAGVTLGRAQALATLAGERHEATAVCWIPDCFRAALALAEDLPANLQIACEPDPPDKPCDLALAPLSMHGEAELARETLQELAHRLEIGGRLLAATDNPRDTWLHEQLAAILPRVRKHPFDDAVVYSAVKTEPLRRRRDFSCEFALRDRGRLLKLLTRPGVFSHRRVDPGARRLMDAAEIGPGERVLDIGCGAGAVALALAAREPTAHVLAVDSHARAVACTQRGAELNELPNVSTLLSANGEYPDPGTYDLAVANPPYYAGHEIAERMVAAAHRSLRVGGRLLAVTKSPQWYAEHLPATGWRSICMSEVKRYHLVSAERA